MVEWFFFVIGYRRLGNGKGEKWGEIQNSFLYVPGCNMLKHEIYV